MSDIEVSSNAGAATPKVIPEGDMKFIMSCLNNTVTGTISVDINAVAGEFGYSNAKSVTNKLAKIRKDYDIPLSSGKTTDASKPTKPTTTRKRTAAKAEVDGDESKTPTPRKRNQSNPKKHAASNRKSLKNQQEEIKIYEDEAEVEVEADKEDDLDQDAPHENIEEDEA